MMHDLSPLERWLTIVLIGLYAGGISFFVWFIWKRVLPLERKRKALHQRTQWMKDCQDIRDIKKAVNQK